MTDDLISRQAAYNTLTEYYHHKTDAQHIALAEALSRVPSASRWIPVTERLPDECVEVNITWVNNEPASYYADLKGKPFTGSGVYCKGRWYWYSAVCVDYCMEYGVSVCDEMDEAIKVTAWMPLPEPWKGESDADNN